MCCDRGSRGPVCPPKKKKQPPPEEYVITLTLSELLALFALLPSASRFADTLLVRNLNSVKRKLHQASLKPKEISNEHHTPSAS